MPCSFSLFPQVWCSSPQTVLKPSAEIFWFIDVFLVFVGGVCGILDVVWWVLCRNCPFSLLAIVLPTQPRKLLAFAASARCWLPFSSIHIKSFHWPASQQSPACIVYSFPSAGQGFCSVQEVPISVWRQVPDLPLPSWGPVFLLSKVPLASEQPWMQPARRCDHLWAEFSWDTWVSHLPLLGISSSNTASQCFTQKRAFLVKTGSKKSWITSALPVCMVTKSPASVAVFSEKQVIILKMLIKSVGTVLWTKVKVFLAWYLVSVVRYCVLFQRIQADINDSGIFHLQGNFQLF